MPLTSVSVGSLSPSVFKNLETAFCRTLPGSHSISFLKFRYLKSSFVRRRRLLVYVTDNSSWPRLVTEAINNIQDGFKL